MSGKGEVNPDEGPKIKEKCNMIPLLEKFEVLDMLDMGMRTADVTPFWCKQINNLCHQEKRR
jgi:hypothetical protein